MYAKASQFHNVHKTYLEITMTYVNTLASVYDDIEEY